MRTGTKIVAMAVLATFAMANQAFAAFWYCPPVPEFDGPSGVAAMTLLVSVGAILLRKSKNR